MRSLLAREPGSPIPMDQRLVEIGFDSLLSSDLVRALRDSLGLPLPSTLTFDHPTARAIVEYLAVALAHTP